MDEFKARLAQLSPEKQKLLLQQLQKKNQYRFEERILPQQRNNSANSFTLSYPQQRLFVLEQLIPGNLAYNSPLLLRLNGKVNVTALKLSLNEMARRHEILRTTFHLQNGTPIQAIAPSLDVAVPVVDFRHLPPVQQEVEIKRLFQQEILTPFNISQLPLWRTKLLQIKEEEYALLLTIHHIIFDGWSVGVLIGEVGSLYEAVLDQKLASLPELPIQYVDYALWQKQKIQGEFLNSQLDYWKQQLAGISSLQLPTDCPFSSVQNTEGGGVLTLEFPETLSHALKQLSHREQTTLNMTMLAAFFALLGRYTQQDDVAVGSVIANRNHREVESLIGFFVNTLVLRSDLSDNPPFSELLKRVRKTTLEAYEHREMPFDLLVEKLQPERDLSRNPLVQVGFAFQNAPTPVSQFGTITVHSIDVELSHARFDLELHLWEGTKGLEGAFVYKTSLFDAGTIARLAAHFQRLLEGIVTDPTTRIQSLPLLTDGEFDQILVEWNNTNGDYTQQCFHEIFEAQVEKNPNSLAVVFADQKLTYYQLNEKSNQIAHYLGKQGVKPEVMVGLCMERSPEMIAGIIGILKAGGSYVPLDPSYPEERLRFILADTKAPVLLLAEKSLTIFSGYEGLIVRIDRDWDQIAQENSTNPNSGVSQINLAYTIYTSGSTGIPKGVTVSHQGLSNLIAAQKQTFDIQQQDSILQFASLNFDASIFEIVMALSSGATLVLGSQNSLMPGPPLVETIQKHSVAIAVLTPSTLSTLPPADLPNIKKIIVAGEACRADLVAQWSHGRHFFNAYGPTEATVWATVAKCQDSHEAPPIGNPIKNTRIYILDAQLQPVPVGVAGELCIAGVGLARGYLNRPDLSAEKFMPNPFSKEPGERIYRTGDLARWLPDGNIQFLGRIDQQVKLRGFRIELGEIEAVISQYPNVREAVVIAQDDGVDNKRLVAYVISDQTQVIGVSELRSFLKDKLPNYMVPSAFVFLEAMPLTHTGKVNRKALPPPADFDSSSSPTYVAPNSEVEQKIAAIWQQALNLEKVGIHDNFFDLGGHSLLILQVHSQLQEIFGHNLSIAEMFQYPTIYSLYKHLNQEKSLEIFDSPTPLTIQNTYKPKDLLQQQRQLRQNHRSRNKQ
ncbi:non-ribosomal peptide synthetase [Aetokthonos hydrillicola Thurmond2011]|jgi:amino acid adenylation domain-containing protein|uniref:Non-ribosomal peptide synthetase n=2 Tax=Aetokthonos TaxID=1550243 RepID=A0AAP5I6F3_9CYAN|nr:non-ribosomal peptide synthetase [Aetokthonos hydrillicola]MBW4583715.1 amino acid adenylation domain-containing protein [Aetokthonos hydrillicola CCALA 1050]MDR9895589.1 non-ribosomal peptide synthetase [Aetokthonos hydrillicola Thurmond2011]WJI96262.1 AesC [Aetokthonos hydrillicola Thurmond2011]